MKKIKTLLLLLGLTLQTLAQTGEWTWMGGTQTTNYIGNYGTMGVSSPTNKPRGLYEATEWTDNQGNFWLYGGVSHTGTIDDLWKYDVSINQWTWIKGSGGLNDVRPIFGIMGIASPANTPGERAESESWTDNQGNLWLFGGTSYYQTGLLCDRNDLWKYNISTNMWTWMKGDTIPSCGGYQGVYGTKGIESSTNEPPPQEEMGLTWADNNDNLWLLDLRGCLWKYRIATNNWIWVNGNISGAPVYGQKGIPSVNNTPGNDFFAYTRWIDSNNNLWLYHAVSNHLKGIFKYEINSNMWTWVWGDTTNTVMNNAVYSDTTCDYTFNGQSDNVIPHSRVETRACWIDACDNLWMMGGVNNYFDFNDLVYFDTNILKWIWAANDTIQNYTSSFGTLGVSSPLNKPRSRCGALPFKDNSGNLWLYGGLNDNIHYIYGDLWKYTMDNGCPPCHNPTVGINSITNEANGISIYPNPFSYHTYIKFNTEQKNTTVKIMNLLGKEIRTINFTGTQLIIEKGEMGAGVYFVQITDQQKNITNKKIIIQ